MSEITAAPKYVRDQVVMAENSRGKRIEPMRIVSIEAKWRFGEKPLIIYTMIPLRALAKGKNTWTYVCEDKIEKVLNYGHPTE